MSSSIKHDYRAHSGRRNLAMSRRAQQRAARARAQMSARPARSGLSLWLVGCVGLVSALMLFNGESQSAGDAPASHTVNLDVPVLNNPPTVVSSLSNVSTTPTPVAKDEALTLTIAKGDTLGALFNQHELSYADLNQILKNRDIKPYLVNVRPGQTIGITHNQGKLQRLTRDIPNHQRLHIERTDNNEFTTHIETLDVEKRTRHSQGQVSSSLFLAGMDAGLSDRTIMNLAGVFAWDIDFILDIRQGDHFSLVHEEHWRDGEMISDGHIVAAEFVNQGDVFRVVRYTDPDGNEGYYTPKGKSVKKAFLRAPLPFSPRVTSNFNLKRLHPIFKTTRPHRGVDYGASTGTPILAAGDGKVIFRGTKGGYGKTVILQHGGNVTTLYAHMSQYKRGVTNNKRVKQGQTIGYVGTTGYATGPHLHYEYRVNGAHKNPRTVKLPAAKPVNKKFKSDFDTTIAPLLAQLDTLSDINSHIRLVQNSESN